MSGEKLGCSRELFLFFPFLLFSLPPSLFSRKVRPRARDGENLREDQVEDVAPSPLPSPPSRPLPSRRRDVDVVGKVREVSTATSSTWFPLSSFSFFSLPLLVAVLGGRSRGEQHLSFLIIRFFFLRFPSLFFFFLSFFLTNDRQPNIKGEQDGELMG